MFPVVAFLPIYLLFALFRHSRGQAGVLTQPQVSESRILFSKVGSSPRFLKYSALKFPQNITALDHALDTVLVHLKWHNGNFTNPKWKDHVWRRLDHPSEAYNHMSHEFEQNPWEVKFHSLMTRALTLKSRTRAFRNQFNHVHQMRREHALTFPSSFHHLRAQAPTRKTRAIAAILLGLVGLSVAVTLLSAWIHSELAAAPAAAAPAAMHSDIVHLGYSANDTAKVLDKLAIASARRSHRQHDIQRFDDAISVLESRFDHYLSAFQMASISRVSPTVVMEADYGALVSHVTDFAATLGLEPAGDFLTDWLQYEAAFVANADGFDIILFVPLRDPAKILTIHRHRRIPIPLVGNIHLSLDPGDFRYVALSKDHQEFRALTDAQFRACRVNGDMHICDGQSFVRRAPKEEVSQQKDGELCLYALATQRFKLAASACHTHLRSADKAIDMVAPTVFAVYYSEPTACVVSCPNRDHPFTLQIRNLTMVHLPPGCTAHTSDYIFSTADVSFTRAAEDWTVSYTWPLGLDQLLEQHDISDLDIIANMSRENLDRHGRILIDNLIAQKKIEAFSYKAAQVHSLVTPAVTLILSLLLGCAIYYLYYRSERRYKKMTGGTNITLNTGEPRVRFQAASSMDREMNEFPDLRGDRIYQNPGHPRRVSGATSAASFPDEHSPAARKAPSPAPRE